jgi:Flp pilus assembly protein CpaB
MQRGRFLILIGIMLAVAAVALLLVMSRNQNTGEEPSAVVGDEGVEELPIPTPAPPTPVPNPVVVARQRIPRGTLLISATVGLDEWVSVESWPMNWVTQEALSSFDQVEGKIARLDIPRGTILTADMLTDQPGDLSQVGSDAALLIPPGKVAMAIPVDHISSVGWALRRGDHVDVLVSFLLVRLDAEFSTILPNTTEQLGCITCPPVGTEEKGSAPAQGHIGRIEQDPFGQPMNVVPSELQRPRLVSQITVRDAMVLNVGPWGELFREAVTTQLVVPEPTAEADGGTSGEGESSGEQAAQQIELITVNDEELTEEEVLRKYLSGSTRQPLLLVVSPQDALVLKWAGDAGAGMHLVLRSYADTGVRLPNTEPVTMQYMTDLFNIALPPDLDYGVDPAVRQLERTLLQELDRLWPVQQTTTTDTQSPPR